MLQLLFMLAVLICLWLLKECFTSIIDMSYFGGANLKWPTAFVVYSIFLVLIAMIFEKTILLEMDRYTILDCLLIICVPLILLIFIYYLKNHIENYLYYKDLSNERGKLIEDREKMLLSKSDVINSLLFACDKVECPFCTGKNIRVLSRPLEKIYVCRNCGRSLKIEDVIKL